MEGTQETVASSSEQNKTLVKPPVQALQFLHLITGPARKNSCDNRSEATRHETRPLDYTGKNTWNNTTNKKDIEK